jgi:hypothetical protein
LFVIRSASEVVAEALPLSLAAAAAERCADTESWLAPPPQVAFTAKKRHF